MLCQKCHKNLASVRYAEVVDGKVTNLHLCRNCLDRQQEDVKSGFELSTPGSFTQPRPGRPRPRPVDRARESCGVCETELQTILDTGRAGCVTCYETFPAQLESLMEGLHVALTHRGKTPKVSSADAKTRVRTELSNKRALMKAALNLENYEEAASLRDDIRVLESGLGASEHQGNN